MMNTIEKPTNDPDKLLKLIKEGDAELLLAEGDLGKGFNKLINLDLISIEDGKVKITLLGEEALETGIEPVIAKKDKFQEVQTTNTNVHVVKPNFNKKIWLLGLLLFLFLLVLLASQMIS
ncbi:hypothetical protein FHG64_05085 [Antarcticibacterium flavum]|uniref:Uncharacterized protein n=1 Tax=Antarcticibacterium flavum TaxID=2058175 RepID=A0A5B7X2I4_9FLAO|nr:MULTISPECIES: hypothetical protein [Antarcticibacterium]MCM4159817.1 hypothetical protein [Antarcticibacterium sp. W02-3]QCY68823.1 hypothetical protein FHG64_05085 [Antarcticibacterium flavum]